MLYKPPQVVLVVQGCANILQKLQQVVQTLFRLCKHSAAMTQVQLTPTDHPRLWTPLAFTIFLKTILSEIRIETRLLCLPLCLFPLQVSRSSKSGLQWWHICKGKKTGEHFKSRTREMSKILPQLNVTFYCSCLTNIASAFGIVF